MKVGITLPQFHHDAEPALDTARRAEAAGLDGVFVFDHLWPLGRPDRPALHGLTLLAALAVETEQVVVGSLVARVGLLPDAVLAHTFATLSRMAGPRLVAGLGVGDHQSRPENVAYGVPFRPRRQRLGSLVDACRRLRARGVVTWVGGNSPSMWAVGRAEADALNLWGVAPGTVSEARSAGADAVGPHVPTEVTWSAQVDLGAVSVPELAAHLRTVAAAGASWAVVAPVGVPWPQAVESLVAATGALVD